MPIVDVILKELEEEGKVTLRVLERIPEDKLTWKPHPKSFSLGQLAMHIAAQGSLARVAADQVHQIQIPCPEEPNHRKEIIDAFTLGLAAAKQLLSQMDDVTITAKWVGQLNGKTILEMPRVAFIRMAMLNHIYHHRGQLSVYLRLLNVAVPSIYGPSADENPFAAGTAA
jgi:uncharacterized damage-inducible protein DinB